MDRSLLLPKERGPGENWNWNSRIFSVGNRIRSTGIFPMQNFYWECDFDKTRIGKWGLGKKTWAGKWDPQSPSGPSLEAGLFLFLCKSTAYTIAVIPGLKPEYCISVAVFSSFLMAGTVLTNCSPLILVTLNLFGNFISPSPLMLK